MFTRKTNIIIVAITFVSIIIVTFSEGQKTNGINVNCEEKSLNENDERKFYICKKKGVSYIEPLLYLNLRQEPSVTFDFILQSYQISYKIMLTWEKLLTYAKEYVTGLNNRLDYYQVKRIKFYMRYPMQSKISVFGNWTVVEQTNGTQGSTFTNLNFNSQSEEDGAAFVQQVRQNSDILKKHILVDLELKKRSGSIIVTGRNIIPYLSANEGDKFDFFTNVTDNSDRQLFIQYTTSRTFFIQPLLHFDTFGAANITYNKTRNSYILKYCLILKSQQALKRARIYLAEVNKGQPNVSFMSLSKLKLRVNTTAVKNCPKLSLINSWFENDQKMSNNDNLTLNFECKVIEDCENFHNIIFYEPKNIQKILRADINAVAKRTIQKQKLKVWPSIGQRYVVIQRRVNTKFAFNKVFVEYEAGFGDVNSNYWIGLRNLYLITNRNAAGKMPKLRIEMEKFNREVYWAEYDVVSVGPPDKFYRLAVIRYNPNSSAGDDLSRNSGHAFSSYDKDHDIHKSKCSSQHGSGGFWFGACTDVNANGVYYPTRRSTRAGIHWKSVDGLFNLKSFKMLLVYD